MYTSPGLFLAAHPVHLGTPLALSIFLAGAAAIYVNYDSDRQRQVQQGSTARAYSVKPRAISLDKGEVPSLVPTVLVGDSTSGISCFYYIRSVKTV